MNHQWIWDAVHGLEVPDPGDLTLLVSMEQAAQEAAVEVARKRPHRKQSLTTHRPAASLCGQGPPGCSVVDVQMPGERPASGVQHQGNAELPVQAPGVGTDGVHSQVLFNSWSWMTSECSSTQGLMPWGRVNTTR